MSDFEPTGSDPDDVALLASAYLDDEATPDERALVETSPEVLDAVAGFGNVRSVLGGTAPAASLSEREGHLAAALDVWERMSDLERAGETTPSDGIDAAAAAAVTTPLSDPRRNRAERRKRSGTMSMPQWALSSAAALVMIAGVGAVVLALVREEGVETSEVAIEAVTEDPATEVDALEAAEAAEVAGENVGADAVPVETDLSSVAAEPGGLFEEEGGAVADAASSDVSTEDAPGSEQPAPAPEIPEIEIENPEDLAAYGSLAVPALAVPALGDGPEEQGDVEFEQVPSTCDAELGLEERLEPVVYQGVEAGVGVDLQNSVVYAYDRDDCSVLASVALPTDTREFDDLPPDTQP
jgi:hypothetical protein